MKTGDWVTVWPAPGLDSLAWRIVRTVMFDNSIFVYCSQLGMTGKETEEC